MLENHMSVSCTMHDGDDAAASATESCCSHDKWFVCALYIKLCVRNGRLELRLGRCGCFAKYAYAHNHHVSCLSSVMNSSRTISEICCLLKPFLRRKYDLTNWRLQRNIQQIYFMVKMSACKIDFYICLSPAVCLNCELMVNVAAVTLIQFLVDADSAYCCSERGGVRMQLNTLVDLKYTLW